MHGPSGLGGRLSGWPDCNWRGFGESRVDFAVEYGVNGIDDGMNRHGSPVLFAISHALNAGGIEAPFPQRVAHVRPAAAAAARAAAGAA